LRVDGPVLDDHEVEALSILTNVVESVIGDRTALSRDLRRTLEDRTTASMRRAANAFAQLEISVRRRIAAAADIAAKRTTHFKRRLPGLLTALGTGQPPGRKTVRFPARSPWSPG
jgi:hypothetical protein